MRYAYILTIGIAVIAVDQAAAQDKLIAATNLDKLNTADDEEDPFPTSDGKELLYASNAKGTYGVYISRRASATAAFGPGKAFLFDKTFDQRSPIKFHDKFYFASNQVPDEKFAKLKNFDIYTQIGTQRAFAMVNDVNTKADEMYPWVTPAGKELYFSRKTDDGWKLFVANGPTPGPIGKAMEVGFPVDFHRATVAGKGLVMYLQGPLEKGKIGIYRSTREKVGGEWSKPAVVAGLNHPESKKGDMQPALNADGSRLYFVSDRPGGKGGLDIWTVPTTSLK
jgi:hypothetical protein